MHLALYFPGDLPVRGYGGTQRVVVWLARGLLARGHRVTLLAGPRTRVPGARLVAVDLRAARRPDFELAPLVPPDVDLVHAHVPLFRPPDRPWVWTLHGNTRPGRSLPPNTVFLSADHARRHGGTLWVHNGVDPADYTFSDRKQDFDLFLGRLHRSKGWDWAVAGARRAERRLVVAGGWRPSLRPGLRFAGEVDGAEKRRLLAEAACLWMPARWDEPFGLTLVEAMMSGTPVLGTRRGALPEIVGPEVGALGDTLEELVSLRPTLDAIAPATCRAWAEAKFGHEQMAAGYETVYAKVLGEVAGRSKV